MDINANNKLITRTKLSANDIFDWNSLFWSIFFWSKKKAEIPKDNTVENKKIKGISRKKSDNSLSINRIPRNQNKIKEKDFVNTSFTNKIKLLYLEFESLNSMLFIYKKFYVLHKKEKSKDWEKIHLVKN